MRVTAPQLRTVLLAQAIEQVDSGRTLVSQLFVPLLGDRVNGPLGKLIDVLAVFATLFGTTTSLGLGALQVNNGLFTLFGIPVSNVTQVVIIAAVTAIFTMSAVTGGLVSSTTTKTRTSGSPGPIHWRPGGSYMAPGCSVMR